MSFLSSDNGWHGIASSSLESDVADTNTSESKLENSPVKQNLTERDAKLWTDYIYLSDLVDPQRELLALGRCVVRLCVGGVECWWTPSSLELEGELSNMGFSKDVWGRTGDLMIAMSCFSGLALLLIFIRTIGSVFYLMPIGGSLPRAHTLCSKKERDVICWTWKWWDNWAGDGYYSQLGFTPYCQLLWASIC